MSEYQPDDEERNDQDLAEYMAEYAEYVAAQERDEVMVKQWDDLCAQCNEAFDRIFGEDDECTS